MTLPERLEYIRPSSMAAIELCPGRALMEARACALVPALRDACSPAARQGTLGHEVVAQTLSLIYQRPDGWMDLEAAQTRMAHAFDSLDPWSRDSARRCLSYGVALVDREVARVGQAGVHLSIERHLSGQGIDIGRGGTADLVIVTDDKAVVADWKLCFLSQGDAADHLQLACYAVMAWDKYQPKAVEIHLANGRRREWSSAIYDAHAIDLARDRVQRAVAAARAECPHLSAGIDQCRYCKALPLCRAARERIMHAAHSQALFGAQPEDRIRLAEDAALARRFAEEAKNLQKMWRKELRTNQSPSHQGAIQ
jgi:hypothetical protein